MKKFLCNLLIISVICTSLSIPAFASETQTIDTSSISTSSIPKLIMQNPNTDINSLSRLKKYDTADNLNIVAFSTPSGNEILNIYPHDIKYIKNNRMYDKDPTIIATSETNSEYMYKNASNSFEIYYLNIKTKHRCYFQTKPGKYS